jgi:enediyne biosynthesis protein E4
VLNVMDSTAVLLRNALKNSNHWLTLKLIGGPKSPRDAIGAKVFVTTGTVRQRADVFSGGSYASSSDQRLHFGLGAATTVDKVEILWPDGAKEGIKIPAIDRILTVVEGKGVAEP